jgi:hypothetical protein
MPIARSVVECASPSAFAARQSAAPARRRLALSAGTANDAKYANRLPAGENFRAERRKLPLPKSVWDGRLKFSN